MGLKNGGSAVAMMLAETTPTGVDNDQAIIKIPAHSGAAFQALRAYALFRLGYEKEAGVAAAIAGSCRVNNGFIRAMLSDDPATMAELRQVYPVVH